eukprot:TRINITY_DN67228_c5_g2_i1.p1 TRINITY_DN67228_c5_g2~~TRINITY_DN67228_c5_g2_i1.p1  ORF type:complete len:270 (-),score=31.43 TRINITY_DN67228_c5_g2_i1:481-1266(-)
MKRASQGGAEPTRKRRVVVRRRVIVKKKPVVQMVVFDMAGTTVNEDNLVYKTIQKTINSKGYAFSLPTVLEIGAGKEKLTAIKDILASTPSKQPTKLGQLAETVFAEFKNRLKTEYEMMDLQTYAGIPDLFQILKAKGIKVCLNTGYDRKTAELLVNKLGWRVGHEIDCLVTASDVQSGRPLADMILLAMDKFGITNPKNVIKVGDSRIDIEEGKNAGCGTTIGVTTGAHTADQLKEAGPTFIFNDLYQDMTPLVRRWKQL